MGFAMPKIPRGRRAKPPGRQHQAAVLPLRLPGESPWSTIDDVLLPEGRAELERLVRDVHEYTERERRDAMVLPRWRTQRRIKATRTEAAVPSLLEALRILRSWTEPLGLEEPEAGMAFRTDAARLEGHRPYLMRPRDRAAWVARHREHSGSRHNYVREVVFARLTRIVETYRRNKKGPLITQDRERNKPYGVLVDVAVALRLPCLPKSKSAIHRAYFRAQARRRPRSDKLLPSRRNNLSP